KLRFGWAFYVPLAALHASLVVRLGPGLGLGDALVRGLGAALNAASLALFAATIAGAVLSWRLMNAGEEAARAGARRRRPAARPHRLRVPDGLPHDPHDPRERGGVVDHRLLPARRGRAGRRRVGPRARGEDPPARRRHGAARLGDRARLDARDHAVRRALAHV